MRDKRLRDLKFKAERDFRLPKGARLLFVNLISKKYNDNNFLPEAEFPLSWVTVNELTGGNHFGVCKKQAYRQIGVLVKKGYLFARGAGRSKHGPHTRYFAFPVFTPRDASHPSNHKNKPQEKPYNHDSEAWEKGISELKKATRKSWDD